MGKKIEKPAVVAPIKAAKSSAKAVAPVAPVKEVVAKKPAAAKVVTAAAKPAAVKAAAPKAKSAATKAPTHAEIQTQAYFVAQRRQAQGLPGDAASDWIQAEKELLAGK